MGTLVPLIIQNPSTLTPTIFFFLFPPIVAFFFFFCISTSFSQIDFFHKAGPIVTTSSQFTSSQLGQRGNDFFNFQSRKILSKVSDSCPVPNPITGWVLAASNRITHLEESVGMEGSRPIKEMTAFSKMRGQQCRTDRTTDVQH